jgi:hypothetical protein
MGVLNLFIFRCLQGSSHHRPIPGLGLIWIFCDRKKSLSLPVTSETSCLYTMY